MTVLSRVRLSSTVIALSALTLAACQQPQEAETPTPTPAETADAAQGAALDTQAAPDAGPLDGRLTALTEAEAASRVTAGPGCRLERGGERLLVAGPNDGVAKIDGQLVDLTGAPATVTAMARGGQFQGGGVVLNIAAAPDAGEGDTVGGVSTQPVTVQLTSTNSTGPARFDAAWVCQG